MADKDVVSRYEAGWSHKDGNGGFDITTGAGNYAIGPVGPEEFAAIMLLLKTPNVKYFGDTQGFGVLVTNPGADE